jgi:mannose-6-phosphate isomerase-like protein (cupin superfamily)
MSRDEPIAHPEAIQPEDHATYYETKMGKATLFESPRMLVGLNAFRPGQEHALHSHGGMDKLYVVLAGEGTFLLEGRALPMRAGQLLVAPEGVPHGIRNTGREDLLVLAVLAPGKS